MPLEIEAKFRVISHEPIRDRLESLGAGSEGVVTEWNCIYDRPDGSLRRAGMGLRIRTAESVDRGEVRATLTVKGPSLAGAFKTREEIETEVTDPDQMVRLLELLGFRAILRFQKRRESWAYGECTIELDEPPHIGLFVEIEGPGEETIRRVQRELGLGGVKHTPNSYVRMLLEYCQKHGLSDRTLQLPKDAEP